MAPSRMRMRSAAAAWMGCMSCFCR